MLEASRHRDSRVAAARCRGAARTTLLGVLAFAILLGAAVWILTREPTTPQRTGPSPAPATRDGSTLPEHESTSRSSAARDDSAAANATDGSGDEGPTRATDETARPSLDVLVFVDEAPADGGDVEILRADPEGIVTVATGAVREGVASFESLDPMRTYRVVVELGYGSRHERRVMLRRAPESIEFRLGTARVFGNARDAHGRAIEGAIVVALLGDGSVVERQPDPSTGGYAIDDLRAGKIRVAFRLGDRTLADREVVLQPGSTQRVDFGATEETSLWTGRVRRRGDVPIAGIVDRPDRAVVVERIRESSSSVPSLSPGAPTTAIYDSDGRFAIALLPGIYRVLVEAPSCGTPLVLDNAFSIDESDLEHDLVLPGTFLEIRAMGFGDVAGLRAELEPIAESEDDRRRRRATVVRPGGAFGFDAVEPGVWRVHVFGGTEPATATITIAPRDTVRDRKSVV